MRSIASLCQINASASLAALHDQQATIHDAIAELCRALDRIDTLIYQREQAHEYAEGAAFTATVEARECCGVVSYAEIRGS
jgi:hypothetical protein